jgi:restriction endonuclease S subunit
VNNHAHILSFKTDATRTFVEYYLNSIDLALFVTGSAQPKLNQANLNRIPIPLPPLAEQQTIVARLEAEWAEMEMLKGLIVRMEAKIKGRVAGLWGE